MKRKIEIVVLILLAFLVFACALIVPVGAAQNENVVYEVPNESERIDASLDWHYIDNCVLTAYCPCEKCCGAWAQNRPNGVVYTASGEKAQQGVTIAVDPSVIPLGSWVEIDGNMYHAEDTGGAVNGNHIDVYFSNHADAWEFGRQVKDVRWYRGLDQ